MPSSTPGAQAWFGDQASRTLNEMLDVRAVLNETMLVVATEDDSPENESYLLADVGDVVAASHASGIVGDVSPALIDLTLDVGPCAGSAPGPGLAIEIC